MKHSILLLALLGLAVPALGDDHEILACTLILEAGGEYAEGAMEAVHEVILNRAAKRGLTAKQVCLQPKQFSCWNSGRIDRLVAKAKSHPRYALALRIVHGLQTNYTRGADHYHADYCNPYWAKHLTRTVKIGRHIFYQ